MGDEHDKLGFMSCINCTMRLVPGTEITLENCKEVIISNWIKFMIVP
jgi:hypothetical protein